MYVILLFQFIVNFAINEKNVEKSLAPPQLSSFVVKKEKKTGNDFVASDDGMVRKDRKVIPAPAVDA